MVGVFEMCDAVATVSVTENKAQCYNGFPQPSRSGGMADAADSKSVGRKPVKVRLLSPAPSARTALLL
jgi:hypothetical protein